MAGESPAVLVAPDSSTQAELQRLVSEALGGANVTLSASALTDSSVLIVERGSYRDASGRRVVGRDLGMPEQFRLIKQGDACLLEHQHSGERWLLHSAVCVAAP
ncbi:MAG: hypothetical protein ACNA7W_05950 [Pseudomonadales bacterium]